MVDLAESEAPCHSRIYEDYASINSEKIRGFGAS
jgi:hypothetical protein